MQTFTNQSDQEFLSTLHRLEPATIQELCDAVGVTATAVRQRLLRLQSEGLIRREIFRQERGRPSHTYEVTEPGLRLLGDDHAEIAAVLWREIMRIEPPDVRQQVLEGVKEALVKRFGERQDDSSLVGRLQRLAESLTEHGFDVEVDLDNTEHGLPILRERSCPYHELVEEDSSICDLEQSVFSELLGVPVELSSCRVDGHRCCEFQVGVRN
jgi:predicted ArsR family transcriptional regulator